MKRHVGIYLVAEAAGGVARHVIDLYWGLKKKDWPVRVILSPTRLEAMYEAEIQHIPSSDLVKIPMRRGPHWSDAVVTTKLKRHFSNTRGRFVLHSHSTKAGLLGAALRPWIHGSLYTPHAYRSIDPTLPTLKRRLIQVVERTFSNTYDRIIAVAPAEFKHAIQLGVPPEKIRHIPNGIRLDRLGEDNGPVQAQRICKAITLGFVGRLAPQKNPLLFIEIVRNIAVIHPEVRAIVVGDGVLREEMRKAARQHGVSHLIDWRGTAPATSVFPEMDVLVHTSLYEGMPYTLIESAASGVPIVATRNDGSSAILGELLPDAIVDSFNPDDLTRRILTICQNPAVRLQHQSSLKQIADRFSVDRMVNDLVVEYEQLLA
jgi:glycosyltransferase involved in cell wall biosynthesis